MARKMIGVGHGTFSPEFPAGSPVTLVLPSAVSTSLAPQPVTTILTTTSAGAGPNEPAGFTLIAHFDGTSTTPTETYNSIADPFTHGARPVVIADANAPNGQALEYDWDTGAEGNSGILNWLSWGATQTATDPGPMTELYFRYSINLPATFDFHTSGTLKTTWIGAEDERTQPGGSTNDFYVAVHCQDERSASNWFGPPGFTTFFRQNPDAAGPTQVGWPSPSNTDVNVVQPGTTYYDVEYHLVFPTAGDASDGEIRIWIDGVLKYTNTSVLMYDEAGADLGFNGCKLTMWWGGSGDGWTAGADGARLGRIYLSGKT